MFPLLMADKLGDFIVGTAVETIETEKLISEYEQVIIDDVYENDKPVESVINNLQEFMQSKGIQLNTIVMEDVYADSEVAKRNVTTWLTAKNLEAANTKVATVRHQ
jgi:C4-type Zn-finger protein